MIRGKQHKATLGDAIGSSRIDAIKTHLTREIDAVARLYVKAKKRIESNGVKYKLTKHRRDAILQRTRVLLQRGMR